MIKVISYDIGTTGLKACLFEIDKQIKLVEGEYETYELYVLENGGAEQDVEEWWSAMCNCTTRLLDKTGIKAEDIEGISFCSQMQGVVLVDEEGNAIRRAMSYMDQRGEKEMKEVQKHGVTVSGVNARKLQKSIRYTSAASTSAKDPIWKYKWVEKNEPDVFEKIYKWLDVKEYLICRMTGEFIMTPDSAYATLLYDSRKGHEGFSKSLCKMYGIQYEHLPRIIKCHEVAGRLRRKQAEELGLVEGIKVYGSGGDATLIGVGAGATALGDTHIYCGTSGWVSTVIDKQEVDIISMIAGIVGATKGRFNYFAEMETAGKCFEWVKDHLALDEIDIYLSKMNVEDSPESEYISLYDYLSDVIDKVNPGSDGVIFTPWLHGNRCPFEDPHAQGIFFNIGINTGKSQMLRAVIEGICFHLRWMLECSEKKVTTSEKIRFVGGGALSPVSCQILADILGREIITIENTKDVGAVGAAMLVALGEGYARELSDMSEFVATKKVYKPNLDNKKIYDKQFVVFKQLYKSNAKNFKILNS